MKSRNELYIAMALLFALPGCGLRQAMYDWGRIKPMGKSDFFADGRSNRPLVEGTIPRGHLDEDDALYRGKGPGGADVTAIPIPVTAELLARGKERFTIYCSVCHGPAGYGDGMVVQRGFKQPPSYHEQRLREAPVGLHVRVDRHRELVARRRRHAGQAQQ